MAEDRFTAEDRKALLASAKTYFTASEKYVNGCGFVTPDEFHSFPSFQENFGSWRGQIRFTTGHILSFRDIYRRPEPGTLERTICFDFRMAHAEKETFRFDAHGAAILGDEPCHLEIGDGNRYEDGHPILKGFSLSNITLCDVIHLIIAHLEEKALPWE